MRSLIIQAFNKCFIECPGCYNYSSDGLCSSLDIVNFVKEIKAISKIKKVTISGGEPLMRPDIAFLVEQLKKIQLNINFDTLGLPFCSSDYLKNKNIIHIDINNFVDKIDMLGIPIDGSTTKIIRMFRNNITIDQMTNVLDNINDAKIDVCINTVVHRGNLNDIKNIYYIVSRYRCIKKWQLFEYMPIGPKGFKNRKHYMLEKENVEEILNYTNNIKEKNKIIEFKTNESRKNNYIFLDPCGMLWVPRMSNTNAWAVNDINNERTILGSIQEKDIVEKLVKGNWI